MRKNNFILLIACIMLLANNAFAYHYSKDLIKYKLAANVLMQTKIIYFKNNNYSTQLLLKEGWSTPENSYRWAIGTKSELQFFIVDKQPLELIIKAMPFEANDGEKQSMKVFLNGTFLKELSLKAGWDKYKIFINEKNLKLGFNSLLFIYKYSKQPFKYSINEDKRYLSVAFDYIEITAKNKSSNFTGADSININYEHNKLIRLPLSLYALEGVEYLVKIPPRARFQVEAYIEGEVIRNNVGNYMNIWAENQKGEVKELLRIKYDKIKLPFALKRKVIFNNKENQVIKLYIANPNESGKTKIILKKLKIEGRMNENPERSSNVIMVLLDALRPDHLSAYGYEKKTSPNIDELSKDGIIFKNAFTQSTFTREAVASLLSALYPLTHNVGYVNKMSDEIIALPEVMKLFNYKTVAFTSNGFINKDCGILQGFDEIYELFRKEFWGPHNSTPGESFIPYIDDWLFNKYKDKYFLFLHFMQPHEPYKAPQSFKIFSSDDPKSVLDGSTYNRNKVKERGIPITSNDVMHMKHLYDDNIYYIDYVVGKLLHKLKLLDLYDNTMVILLSDHGEEFMEHGGFSHSMHLYDECLHFTLIIKMPQNMYKGKEIKSLVQLIDIPNTILEAVGINKTIGQGKSLMPLLKEHSNTEVHNAIFASRKSFIGLRTHRYKYIENINSNGVELYDLLTDPLEQVNIVDKNPEIAKQMSELLKGWRQNQKAYVPKGSEEIDEQTKEILRSLGYLR